MKEDHIKYNTVISVIGEYCHDLFERYDPLVTEVRKWSQHCTVTGVFTIFGKEIKPGKHIDIFDEMYCFPIATQAAHFVSSGSCHKLIVFVNHNVTINDYLLWNAFQSFAHKPVFLFRNTLSLNRYLQFGTDDSVVVSTRLTDFFLAHRVERAKIVLLTLFTKIIFFAGKLWHKTVTQKNDCMHILYLRLDLLGDMIVTMPYLAAIKHKFPDSVLTVMASSRGAIVLKEQNTINPDICLYDRLIVWDAPWHRKQPSQMGFIEFCKALMWLPFLWNNRFDVVIQPVNLGTGVMFALLAIGKRCIASVDPLLPLSLSLSSCLTDPVIVQTDRIPHVVDFLASTCACLDVQAESIKPILQIHVESLARMNILLSGHGHLPDKKLVLVNIGAGNRLRRWGSGNFAALINILIGAGEYSFVITGAKTDVSSAEEVLQMTNCSIVNTVGQLSLNELIALISLTDLVITVDTAVMHMAAALNKPLVAIYGAGLVDYCSPVSTNHVIIKNELGCSGCGDRCFSDNYPPPCLVSLRPGAVFNAALQLLNQNKIF